MSKKKYVLVVEDTLFYDSHGEGDYGGTTKFVSDESKYTSLEEGKTYDNDFEEVEEDEDEENEQHCAEDGYNCEVTTFSIKFIDESDYWKHKAIIEAYEQLTTE